MIAGVSVALVGGGTAYAAHVQQVSGLADGLNCQQVWGEGVSAQSVGGPSLTGDPIADCDVWAADAAKPRIADPVAFVYQGMTFVTPADQVPEGAALLQPSPTAAASRELEATLRDQVDGLRAVCDGPAAARAFVESELGRLGLSGWTVTDDGAAGDPPCTGATVDVRAKTVTILPRREEMRSTVDTPDTTAIQNALRAGITDSCVTATDARAIADAALAGLDYEPWPTTTVVDESVPCARVDMEVGGNVQVTVYGPTVARP
jgi:hypothetical protein